MVGASQIVASPMSIDLPRPDRALHFTGSVKALAPERPANALGQERPKGPPPSPTRALVPPPQPRTMRQGDVYIVDAAHTPYVGARPSARADQTVKAGKANRSNLPTMRGQLASMDDDSPTCAIDKSEIEAALFPVAKRAKPSSPPPNLPVPGFRSAKEVEQNQIVPTVIVQRPKGGSLPLGVWLGIALIAAVVSFNLAPQAAESLAEVVRTLEGR